MVERWLAMGSVGNGVVLLRNFEIEVTELSTAPTTSATPPGGGSRIHDDRPLSDVWVYVTLALMAVSCVGCVCSCLLYHKFQQWKLHHSRRDDTGSSTVSSGRDSPGRMEDGDEESLPSYTLVTGLPSYQQAMEQLKEAKKLSMQQEPLSPLCVANLLLQAAYPPPPPPPTPPTQPRADIKS